MSTEPGSPVAGPSDRSALRAIARATAIVYVVLTVAALFAEFGVRGQLIVRGDTLETAERIARAQTLFRLGIAADVVALICDAALAALLYRLLRPAGASLAAVAASFRLAMVAFASAGIMLSIVALRLIDGAPVPPEPEILALLLMEARTQVVNAGSAVFGAHLVAVGWLVSRCDFLPKWLGFLLMVGGATYLIHGFGSVIVPGLLKPFFPAFAGIWALAEWSFIICLLLVGRRREPVV